jgi:hypothetical protein
VCVCVRARARTRVRVRACECVRQAGPAIKRTLSCDGLDLKNAGSNSCDQFLLDNSELSAAAGGESHVFAGGPGIRMLISNRTADHVRGGATPPRWQPEPGEGRSCSTTSDPASSRGGGSTER